MTQVVTNITIGNWYLVRGKFTKVTPANIVWAFRDGCQPIPLTPAILEKSDFILRNESPYRKEYDLVLPREDGDADYFCVDIHEKGGYCKVYYNPLDSITHISYNIKDMTVHHL